MYDMEKLQTLVLDLFILNTISAKNINIQVFFHIIIQISNFNRISTERCTFTVPVLLQKFGNILDICKGRKKCINFTLT